MIGMRNDSVVMVQRQASLSLGLQIVGDGGDSGQETEPASAFLESQRSETTMAVTARTRRRRDPRLTDRQNQLGGELIGMCGQSQKAIGLARGWSKGWVSKVVAGHPSAGAYLRLIEDLERFEATDASPLAVAPLVMMLETRTRTLSNDDLRDAERVAYIIEEEKEAEQDRLTLRLLLAREENKPAHVIHQLRRDVAKAFVASAAADIVVLSLLWESDRRAVVSGEGAVH